MSWSDVGKNNEMGLSYKQTFFIAIFSIKAFLWLLSKKSCFKLNKPLNTLTSMFVIKLFDKLRMTSLYKPWKRYAGSVLIWFLCK
jgi:hypothetical protein